MFTGIFVLLAFWRRQYPGLWQLVIMNKAALTIVEALLIRNKATDAMPAVVADGILTIVLIAATNSQRGNPETLWFLTGAQPPSPHRQQCHCLSAIHWLQGHSAALRERYLFAYPSAHATTIPVQFALHALPVRGHRGTINQELLRDLHIRPALRIEPQEFELTARHGSGLEPARHQRRDERQPLLNVN